MNSLFRHPEVRAQRHPIAQSAMGTPQRASKGDGPEASAASFEARRAGEHLRMTDLMRGG